MEILFLPNWSQGNPYQRLLKKTIEENDIKVKFGHYKTKWPILLNSIKANGGCDVLHIHWIDQIVEWLFWSPSKLKSYIKVFMFLIDLTLVKFSGVKLVWTVHNKFKHEKVNRFIERIICKMIYVYSERVFVHSPSAVKVISQAYHIKNDNKFRIIEHGHFIDSYKNEISKKDARKALGINDSKIIFLHFGNIRPYKGITHAIDAFIKDELLEDAVLILAGKAIDKTFEKNLELEAKKVRNIRLFFEFISDDKLQIFLNAADVCIFPFEEILTSGSVILAMSFKKAIVVPAKGCLVDIVDQQGAFFFDQTSDFVKTIDQCLEANLVQMGNHNFDLIKQYDWSGIGKKIADNYIEICGGKKV